VGRKRERKIAHVTRLLDRGVPKTQVREKAIHFMKMSGDDIVAAFQMHGVESDFVKASKEETK
jgi:hypothetical protein